MKKLSLGLFVAPLLLIMGCDPDAGGDRAALALDKINETRTIRAAYINYPPSFVVDPNSKAKGGIMHEAAVAVADAMEVKLQYVEETSWATMIDTLSSGRADMVVSGIWPSSTRALKADFSRVVYYSPIHAYVRAGDNRFDGDLAKVNRRGIRIATIDGELSSIVARTDFPEAAAVALPQQTDIAQLLLQLSTDKADLTFVEPAVAQEFMDKNPGVLRRVANVEPVRIFPNTFL